jgi:hypothetical protein
MILSKNIKPGGKDASQRIVCLSCGVFRMEIESLARQGKLDCRIITLESMLHMKPEKLRQEMETVIAAQKGSKILILYGDCHPYMHEIQSRENFAKVDGMNCCEIFLGTELYKKLQREQAFIFLPEWTQRWREIFHKELGFEDQEIAGSFMRDIIRQLVYVDTGVIPVPHKTLHEISEYFGMPVEILNISLDNLQDSLNNALIKLNRGYQNGQ